MIPARPEAPPRTPLRALVDLLPGQPSTDPVPDVTLTGLTMSSRSVLPGDLYVAPAGATTHGARFASDAVRAGAVAVLTDGAGADLCRQSGVDVPVLVVPAPRSVVGALAARLYGDPASALRLLGVTGTQGKTTTTRLAEGALQAAGTDAAVIGTVGARVAGADVSSALTTPEAPELHALFAVMRERGVEACAMEVSSHALVMGRVDGVVFDVAAFLNLGRDHLDFHADVEDYYRAKAALFTPERSRLALVNIDDAHGRRLAAETELPVRTFSPGGAAADWRAIDVAPTATGSVFTVQGPGVEQRVEVPIPGEFNVDNALCAVAGLAELGYDVSEVAEGMRRVAGVPGRLEPVDEGQDFLALVDYAHKPDAVEAVLRSLRGRTSGRLIVVLGAGGDRDKGKRPLMGEMAGRLADVVVVTDDNPRSEDPAKIRAEVLAGTQGGSAEVHEVGDRRAAIGLAVEIARTGDCVVVAGKGHETGQEIAGAVHPFDDRLVLRGALGAVAAGRRRKDDR